MFGRIFVSHELEDAMITLLETWFYTALTEVTIQLGLDINDFPLPTRYTNRNTFDAALGEQLPRVVVIAGGMTRPPRRDGGGGYTGWWKIDVGIAAAHEDEVEVRRRVGMYAAAIRWIVMHKPSLGGFCNNSEFVDERPAEVFAPDQLLQYRAMVVSFECEVPNIVLDHPVQMFLIHLLILRILDHIL